MGKSKMWTSVGKYEAVTNSKGKICKLRIPRHVLFNNGHVHAVETKPQKKSSAPNSMGYISDSPNGLLARAKRDDITAYLELISVVARMVHARGWQIEGREAELSKIILSGYVFGDQISSAEAGRMMGITRQAYNKTWKPKVSEIQVVVSRWTTS